MIVSIFSVIMFYFSDRMERVWLGTLEGGGGGRGRGGREREGGREGERKDDRKPKEFQCST